MFLDVVELYHKVNQNPAFMNVNDIAGTAQMAGHLFNYSKDGSSIVVIAGLNGNEVFKRRG